MVIRFRSSRSITTSGATYGSTMPALAAGEVRLLPAIKLGKARLISRPRIVLRSKGTADCREFWSARSRGRPGVAQAESDVQSSNSVSAQAHEPALYGKGTLSKKMDAEL